MELKGNIQICTYVWLLIKERHLLMLTLFLWVGKNLKPASFVREEQIISHQTRKAQQDKC